MKKITAILLILSILALLVSCGTEENPAPVSNEVTSANPDSDVESAEENQEDINAANSALDDDLGEYDFEGYVFNFYTRDMEFFNGVFDFEELTGELLDDAIYERNRRIEERFNITFNNIVAGDSSKARTSILAGDGAYDVVMTRNPDAFITFAQNGLAHGFDALTHINLDKPYWDDSVNENLTIANKRYFACSSFNLSAYDFVHVLIFNKNLVANYGLQNPYDMVKGGTWTYDAFTELMKNATADVDGDGVMGKNDAYGYLSSPKQVLPNLWISAGIKSIEKDQDDLPYSIMGTERFLEIFQKIYAITRDTNAWFHTTTGANVDPEIVKMFENDQALFMDSTFFYMTSLRNMTSDFGILPYPKYNEQQEKYYSRMEGCELFFVPITATQEDCDRASIILEAMSSDSAKTVIPVYYNLALKTKFTRDEESAEIMDLLFENRVFDLGDTVWCDKVRDPIFGTMFQQNNRDLVSKLDAMNRTLDKLISNVVNTFQELD